MSGVGPVQAVSARRPEINRHVVAPTRDDQPHGVSSSQVDLAAWFDRNGDGRIDTNTWVNGGDAYLLVDKDVSALLDHRVATHTRERSPAVMQAAASAAYRRYGEATTVDTKP